MKGLSLVFICAAALCGLAGMAWGIQMSITHDHSLSPAHAHLNLVGWVSLAIFGFFYHAVPTAAASVLAKLHAALAIPGVVLMAPGIALAISGKGEALAVIGSLLTFLSMLTFVIVLFTRGRG